MIAKLVEEHCLLEKTLKNPKKGSNFAEARFSNQTRKDAINNLTALNRVNPTRDYLNSLNPAINEDIEITMTELFDLNPDEVMEELGYNAKKTARYAY